MFSGYSRSRMYFQDVTDDECVSKCCLVWVQDPAESIEIQEVVSQFGVNDDEKFVVPGLR